MVMIIFNHIVFFNVKVSLFSYFFNPFMLFFLVLVNGLFIIVFCLFCVFVFLSLFFLLRKPGVYFWV